MSIDISKLFIEDPGYAYHELSKLPFRYVNYCKRSPSFPGFDKKLSYIREIKLPKPEEELFKYSVPEVLKIRRSIREFINKPLSINILSTLLYYIAGVKDFEWGYPIRMFPSAGALNSPEIYLSVNLVEDLDKGLYHYNPFKHALEFLIHGDINRELYNASLHQEYVLKAPIDIILTAVYDRTMSKYSARAYRYILLDAGHLGMNIYIVSTALGLGTVCVGAFEDDPINKVLNLSRYEFVLAIYPIGYYKR